MKPPRTKFLLLPLRIRKKQLFLMVLSGVKSSNLWCQLFLLLLQLLHPLTYPVSKVFGAHTLYEGGGGGGGGFSRTPLYDLENGRLYKLQTWQAIRTIYER